MKAINFSLTLDETNKVLEALSLLPFAQVHQLIAKIHGEATDQLTGKNDHEDTEDRVKALAHG